MNQNDEGHDPNFVKLISWILQIQILSDRNEAAIQIIHGALQNCNMLVQ